MTAVYARQLADDRWKGYRKLVGSRVPHIASGAIAAGVIDLVPDSDDPSTATVVLTWTDGNGERTQTFGVSLAPQ